MEIFNIVREKQAIAAGLVLEGQRLGFKFDLVVPKDLGADVHLGRFLHVGMAEFEDNLGVADGEAVFVGHAATQDERIVLQLEVGGIEKQDFANLRSRVFEGLAGKADVGSLGGAFHDFAEVVEIGFSGEAVTFEDELAFEVFDLVKRVAVGVLSLFEIGDPT